LINPNFSFYIFVLANPNQRWVASSPRNPNFLFVDDPGKLYMQRRRATQAKGLETLDPKAEDEGLSKSPRESPPPNPKEDQPQLPPMREQPQSERNIELCTPDVVDLPIINLQDAGRPFKIKVTTIRMVQHSPFTGKEDPNLHLQAFFQLCQIFDEEGFFRSHYTEKLCIGSTLHRRSQNKIGKR
jgi:hypothetical protein